MLGALAGDIIGSVFERSPCETPDFHPLFYEGARFTDDSVLTVAQMDQVLSQRDWVETLVAWFRRYPRAGYGGNFATWCLRGGGAPYQSWGNGSAMRVSPVGWVHESLEATLEAARASAVVTHSHPEGVKGAQATAAAIFLARQGQDREAVRGEVARRFGYDLDRSVAEIRPGYRFDVSCQGSVPEALVAAFEAKGIEEAIRLAISLGGDADTQACIAGAVAEAFEEELPTELLKETWARLEPEMQELVRAFYARYRPEVALPEGG